jgi:hypothetical protein
VEITFNEDRESRKREEGEMDEATAKRIVNLIFEDILDRQGLGDELDQVTPDIQREIKVSWRKIILKEAP